MGAEHAIAIDLTFVRGLFWNGHLLLKCGGGLRSDCREVYKASQLARAALN